MPKNKLTQDLLNHSAIWRASEFAEGARINPATSKESTGIDTGFDCFNQRLADGGWPRHGVIEILYDRPGTGELSLLLPLLHHFSQAERWLVWVAPPYCLHAPALAQAGVDSQHILQVWPTSDNDRLWCTEEALKSGAASLVLSWPGYLKPEHVRRLQIVSSQYQIPCVLFRENSTLNTACTLRLYIRSINQEQVEVHILKRRRGWSPPPFTFQLRRCPEYRYQTQRKNRIRSCQQLPSADAGDSNTVFLSTPKPTPKPTPKTTAKTTAKTAG